MKGLSQASNLDGEGRRRVVVRTHGGLGNQIFQMLYSRLMANGSEPHVVHDANYPHAFGLSDVFAASPVPNPFERMVSAIRIPKIIERARLSARGTFPLGPAIFLDGYFQSPEFYRPFPLEKVRTQIDRLRMEFGVRLEVDSQRSELHHIRLGDFFDTEQAQREHLTERLAELPDGAFIITNHEDLVGDAIGRSEFSSRLLHLVPSQSASPAETLRLMSEYRTIVSNDSTLAFWAACLGNRTLVTPSPMLNNLLRQLATGNAQAVTG